MKDTKFNKIANEVFIDRNVDHLSNLTDVNQTYKTLKFKVDENEYIVKFTIDQFNESESLVTVSFENLGAIKKLQQKKFKGQSDMFQALDNAKHGITDDRHPFRVFNIVYNVVGKFIEKFRPNYFRYESVEDNRKSLYIRSINRLQKESVMKFNRIFVDPLTGDNVSTSSQLSIYKISY